ncbi:C40 family peptidase [Amycolatopsis sp. FDAARGOS 1241]|uniref:C40 family peptidase n=1 Tax=Amycolatopsis sp. FDAARGOS 1241 TaxID=2778070 RepID=UPI00194F5BFE|nr:C40 family peptidase [Amycolatopsis sp. FDAARGOS 1241]QRP44202.1 C40 family peptidase [Amycolatopsis sp. FDAARGOS 1241]
MQSHPVKRVVSGALAAASVIAVVTVAQPSATAIAAPVPALQTPPDSGSSALQKYRDLASQAEKANEDLLKAQDDLKAKQGDLDKANADADHAKQLATQAEQNEQKYKVDVDKFAGASFLSGVQMNKLSALLAGTSTQEFLERSSALDQIASEKDAALDALAGAVKQAEDAAKLAADSAKRATDARDAAAKLTDDIKAKQKTLQDQIKQLKATEPSLSALDRALQGDKGSDAPTNIKAPGPAAQAAVDAALSRLGDAYVWGATGPSTFDCSGLMQWAYRQAGISLPRSSREQSTFGTPVARSQLQPGDLVFYYTPVSHVGMYIGDGKMVHAPTTGDVVKISPLQSQYVGARRVS